jgi:hypothetical protein
MFFVVSCGSCSGLAGTQPNDATVVFVTIVWTMNFMRPEKKRFSLLLCQDKGGMEPSILHIFHVFITGLKETY